VDIRYEVFVSSTFQDLEAERRAVIQAILELNHIPTGMELFPATSEDSWDLIESVIDHADYYVLVVAGRYGSVTRQGLSFTEREYRYAKEQGIPILAFLHKNPDSIPTGKTDKNDDASQRLHAFRAQVERAHHVRYYLNPDDLSARVVQSLVQLIKTKPREGWVRRGYAETEENRIERKRLRDQVESLQARIEAQRSETGTHRPELAQGADVWPVEIKIQGASGDSDTCNLNVTWERVFLAIAGGLLGERDFHFVRADFSQFITKLAAGTCGVESGQVALANPDGSTFQALMQFRALGLVETQVREYKERATGRRQNRMYWKLSLAGEEYYALALAIRRPPTTNEQERVGAPSIATMQQPGT